MKKIIAVTLSVILVISAFAIPTGAFFCKDTDEKEEPKEPLDIVTIFVEGINCGDITDAETGETLFPPKADKIVSAVAKQLPYTLSALVKGDDEAVIETLVDGVMDVCGRVAMDENGNPTPDTAFDYTPIEVEEIQKKVADGEENHRITYCYDWRLDMKTIATGLHDFIQYVKQAAGVDKVNLVGFSMGATAVMSFLKLYENEYSDYVNGVVLLAGGYNGTSTCGEPFSQKVNLDKTSLINYVDSMLGFDLGALILSTLVHQLGTLSVTQKTLDLLNAKMNDYIDGVYQGMFMQTFGSIPGLWSLIPDENFEDARKIVPDTVTDEFIEKIDWYHTNVAANKKQITDNLIAKGLRFGIIVKYGYAIVPVTQTKNSMSDGVIDTKYESWGATCADVGSTLGDDYVQKVDNGHNCISADRLIDSSTCTYCDKTWFIKNCEHSAGLDTAMELFTYIFYNDKQPTVFDGKYSQFLIGNDGNPVELTATNYINRYSDNISDDTFFGVVCKAAQKLPEAVKVTIIDFINKIIDKINNVFTRLTDVCTKTE